MNKKILSIASLFIFIILFSACSQSPEMRLVCKDLISDIAFLHEEIKIMDNADYSNLSDKEINLLSEDYDLILDTQLANTQMFSDLNCR